MPLRSTMRISYAGGNSGGAFGTRDDVWGIN